MAKTAKQYDSFLVTTRATDIKAIEIGQRARKELGDLDALAVSIKQVGLLQPVVNDSDNKLIAGRRRIEACKKLGWKQIPTVVAESVDSLFKALSAESDENICRKDFEPGERIQMGLQIEAEVSRLAKEEQKKSPGRPRKDAKKVAKVALP